MTKRLLDATFAAGCFWGVEDKFMHTKGVVETEAGYTGGSVDNPTYKLVCSGTTGHAEAVHIKYDPDVINYEELLKVFWDLHDPTQVDRQGPDVGRQYRSAIFYYNDAQKELAEKSKKEEQVNYKKEIATEIVPAKDFYRAEEYHQKYVQKTGRKVC